MLGITTTNARVGGFRGGISAEAKTIYNRIIADGGVSNLTRLNFFVKGLKAIYGDLANVPVCYDAHWIGYKLGSGTGATAGQAAAKLYSLTVAGDAVQATAASQPLLLAHNGASSDNYWYGSGVSGNFVITPNAAANQITGDIEIIVKVDITTDATNQCFVSKYLSFSQFLFRKNSSNFLQLIASKTSGAEDINATSTVAITSGLKWYKLTRNATNGEVKFYSSTDGTTYTQLGATVTATSGNMVNGTDPINVGVFSTTGNPILGKIYNLTLSNTIGGTPVVNFNPAQYNASTSQTAWTSATGEVWTINTGTATTGYKGVLVDRTIVMSDGVDDRLFSSAVTVNQPDTIYVANKLFDLSGNNYIFDGDGLNRQAMFANQTIFANLSLNTAASVGTSIHLTTGVVNGLTSTIDVNNVLSVTGATGTNNLGGLYLFSRQSGTFGMTSVRTFIISNSADNSTVRTATYNLIRSLNNNAF